MSTKSMPTSKAKTAYGLLSEICKLITEEPKRYAQMIWIARKSNEHESCGMNFPPCGTVGCVAGWVATLKGPQQFEGSAVSTIASRVLGLRSDEQNRELFDAKAVNGRIQTTEYAAEGVKHIRRFQQKYASQLKAKKV